MTHPTVRLEARALVHAHDGGAEQLVADRLQERLDRGDVDEALRLDQVRREIGRLHGQERR